ncbi:hypothetical protein ACRYCC_42585 [Actinomadura scrupuli]|uniref:hypothetical protein n=1 Tax=Actinomadura scrupuli TaxID=559629 RepID=UPI003D97DBD8
MLGGTLALGLPLVAGCRGKPAVTLPPDPDVATLNAAINAESGLIALYEAVIAQHPGLAQRLTPLVGHHREHLSVLRKYYVPGSGEGTPAPARPTPPGVPDEPARAVVTLRTAERQAAAGRLADVETVPAGLAQLFASIGACEAGHAAVLARPA